MRVVKHWNKLSREVQRGCRDISGLGDVKNLSRQSPEQPGLADPALSREVGLSNLNYSSVLQTSVQWSHLIDIIISEVRTRFNIRGTKKSLQCTV